MLHTQLKVARIASEKYNCLSRTYVGEKTRDRERLHPKTPSLARPQTGAIRGHNIYCMVRNYDCSQLS
jgi:hypothetical protein